MSHPDPSRTYGENEKKENFGKKRAKHSALAHRIEELRERKGESPLHKLKRLTK